jgi:hypothetical protein
MKKSQNHKPIKTLGGALLSCFMMCAAFAQEGMWRGVKRSLFYCFT